MSVIPFQFGALPWFNMPPKVLKQWINETLLLLCLEDANSDILRDQAGNVFMRLPNVR